MGPSLKNGVNVTEYCNDPMVFTKIDMSWVSEVTSKDYVPPECGKMEFNGTSGSIESLHPYSANLDCSWTIQPRVLEFLFSSFF